jgi:hypothetical protein
MIWAHPVIFILHDSLVRAEGAGHQSLQALKNSKTINKPSRKRADYHTSRHGAEAYKQCCGSGTVTIFSGSGSDFRKLTVPVPTFALLGSGSVSRP